MLASQLAATYRFRWRAAFAPFRWLPPAAADFAERRLRATLLPRV